MSFLFSALRGETGKPQNAVDTIDKLCDRVANATLQEDKRASVLGLKGLARDWKKDVGTKGMGGLLKVLTENRADTELLKPTLELLQILCSTEDAHSPSKAATPGSPGSDDAKALGIMFSEIYIKTSSNVAILLDLLEETDFYVRFNVVQLLATLLANLGDRLHDAILTSPLGISRLMDLLDDKREIIRNEGLLLLVSLTKSNAEIQKIIAFENAFERLLGIVLSEGASDGGIIVQDCMTLTLNLLRYNVSNQNLFRESSCIQRINRLLLSRPDDSDTSPPSVPLTSDSTPWTEQKIINVVLILELVRVLVGPNNPTTQVNQTIMFQANLITPILDIALQDHMRSRVKAQALYAVGEAMRGNAPIQDLFSKHIVAISVKHSKPTGNPLPKSALLTVIGLALRSEEDFNVRAASAFCFQSLFFNNPDHQLAVAATLTPPPSDNPNAELSEQPQSPGSLLVSTILNLETTRKDPYKAWFASVMLAHVLQDNSQCQEMALSVRFVDDGEEEPISLLHKVMFALLKFHRDPANADPRISVGIMSLIATWLYASPRAVREFLSEGSNLQFLIEQINHSSGVDPLVQGLASYLLALCHEFNDDSEPAFTKQSLQTLIVSRIGADVFASRLERLKESRHFQKVSAYFQSSDGEGKGQPDVYFDAVFAELLKSTSEGMVRGVISPQKKSAAARKEDAAQKSAMESFRTLLATQDKELSEVRRAFADSEARRAEEAAAFDAQIKSLQNTVHGLERALAESREKQRATAREQEDLLVCLAESDFTIRTLKDRLRALGQDVSDDDEEDEKEEGREKEDGLA